jgi:UDP-N-acetyl-D-mannosaminuronic acid dehydrogenase
MKISVIGLGYIGLPTAAILASRSIQVTGVDVNEETVKIIKAGKIHIVEPELDVLVRASVQAGNLKVTTVPEPADIFLIAVPTPFKDDLSPDLSYVERATKSISPVLKSGNLVILESTSPVGTSHKMIQWMQQERSDLHFPTSDEDTSDIDIHVAHCPERVLPGRVIRELITNDRIIGGITKNCAEKAKKFYELFVEGQCFITDAKTAELSKLVENSFRDVNIAFANELSMVCDKLNINVWELIQLANRHPRVNILQPGPGVGGHCIAVDPWFIVSSAPEQAKLIRTAREVNDSKPKFVLDEIERTVHKIQRNKSELTIACLGLTFKPNIDDLRESPALKIALKVSKMGFKNCIIVEPNIQVLPKEFPKNTEFEKDYTKMNSLADICLILVKHDIFKTIKRQTNVFYIDTCGAFRQ